MISNRDNAPHYRWGDGCDGWRLHESGDLGVIEELVPPGRCEVPHFHTSASQVFVILAGHARMRLGERTLDLAPGDSLHVPAGVVHQFRNDGGEPVRFLVISSPRWNWDRIETPDPH